MAKNDLKDFFEQAFDITSEKASELMTLTNESEIFDLADELVSLGKVVGAISKVNNWFFARKIRVFSEQLKTSDTENFKYNWEKTNPKRKEKIILQLLIQLERANTDSKAQIYAELVKARVENRITPEQFDHIIYSVDMMHPMGIDLLKVYYDYSRKIEVAENNDKVESKKLQGERASLDYSTLSSSGFLRLPSGGVFLDNLGGASISELGAIFCEQVLFTIRDN